MDLYMLEGWNPIRPYQAFPCPYRVSEHNLDNLFAQLFWSAFERLNFTERNSLYKQDSNFPRASVLLLPKHSTASGLTTRAYVIFFFKGKRYNVFIKLIDGYSQVKPQSGPDLSNK